MYLTGIGELLEIRHTWCCELIRAMQVRCVKAGSVEKEGASYWLHLSTCGAQLLGNNLGLFSGFLTQNIRIKLLFKLSTQGREVKAGEVCRWSSGSVVLERW